MRITDYFWTTTDIENEWENMRGEKAQEDDKGEKVWKKEVRRNFIKILKKIKSEQDEDEDNVIAYYKTSDKGDFIFQDNETPRRMQEILELSGKIDLMSCDEKEEIIKKYKLRRRKIEKMVDHYYIKTRSDFLYQKKLFVEVEGGKYADNQQRMDMYKAQYKYLKTWQINWDAFMNKVVSIRKVEKCLAVRENQRLIPIKNFYENEAEKCGIDRKYNENELKKYISTKDDWRMICEAIVGKITNHPLRGENKEDFDFLVIKAFEELEDIMDEIREKYMEKSTPKLRDREDIRNEKIDRWHKDICNNPKGSCKEISKEDLGYYYDALEEEYRKGRRGKINVVEKIKNLSEDDRARAAQEIELAMFDIYSEFKPLKKQG